MLSDGDPAPEFALLNQHKEEVSLLQHRGHKVLIYFYPKADTPGCTTQSCSLRDIAGEVGDTAIIGISPDNPDDQLAFDQKYHLGFPLLADDGGALAREYDVWGEITLPNGAVFVGVKRAAFLIDADGAIERAWYNISPLETPQFLLLALQP